MDVDWCRAPIPGSCRRTFRSWVRRTSLTAWRAVVLGTLVLCVWAVVWPVARPAWGAGRDRPVPLPPDPLVGRPTVGPSPGPTGTSPCPPQSSIAPADWPLLWCDTFDDNAITWDVGAVNLDAGTLRRAVAEGVYSWDLEGRQSLLGWSEPALGLLTDFYAAVDVRLVSGTAADVDFGLAIRPRDLGNMHLFLASAAHGVTLWRGVGDTARAVIDWTPTSAIRPNDWNRLAVKAVGSHLTLYVNDQPVAELPDRPVAEGQLGVVVRASKPGHSVVQFDNFEVRAAPGSPVTPPAVRPPAAAAAEELASPAEESTWGKVLPQSSRVVPADWPIVFEDTFESNGNRWPIGEDFGGLIEGSKLVDKTLAWQFKALQGVHSVVEVPYHEVADFYAAVDVRRYSGPEDVWYGLTVRRVDPDHFYSFLVNDARKYQILAQARDKWYRLVDPTPSEAIRAGEPNRVGVMGQGPRLTFFINGQPITELEITSQDILFRAGALGLALSANTGDEGIIEFDNFELRTPPGQ